MPHHPPCQPRRPGDEPDAQSSGSVISGDGRYVVVTSDAANLTPQPDTNQADDVFRRDLDTGTTQLISQPQET